MMLEKTEHMIWLLDFYRAALTDKQQEILALYYEDDLTLGEIAEQTATSRQAVHDLVSRSGRALARWEEKLGLVRRFKSSREKLLSLRRLAEAQAATPERDELLGELDDIIRTL